MAFVAPQIIPGATAGTVGSAYDYIYAVNPGSFGPPYTFAVSVGALPTGLSLNTSTGEITGTPTTSGTASYTIAVYSNSNPSYVGSNSDSITIAAETNYNCACSNNEFPTRTLAQLRNDLMSRLGFAAMLASPPPGMNGLLDSFLTEAQELLYRRYKVFQGERWFTWSMKAGTRFYDTAQNDDAVNGLLQPPVMGAITTATVGGTLLAGTYGYLVTALNANGETTPGAEVSITTTGSTSTNTINWSADTGSTGYKVYGRTVAGEWFMASIAAGTLTFTDTGAITPSTTISPPDVNTTPACSKTLDPRMVTWVGISQSDNNWRPLRNGINPVRYSSIINAIPDSYEIRQCIEVWPAPPDNTWKLRIKGYFGLMPLLLDNDSTTIDYRAVALLALANAKAHYGQPDANNYAAQLNTLMGDLNAGSHMTRRYVPGQQDKIPTVWPVIAP